MKKYYGRRKIFDNTKPDLDQATEDESRQLRGADFSSLIDYGASSGYFRFQQEKEADEELASSPETRGFLKLDVEELATAVNSIPLYKRFEIEHLLEPSQIVKLDEEAAKYRKNYNPAPYVPQPPLSDKITNVKFSSSKSAAGGSTIKPSTVNIDNELDQLLNNDGTQRIAEAIQKRAPTCEEPSETLALGTPGGADIETITETLEEKLHLKKDEVLEAKEKPDELLDMVDEQLLDDELDVLLIGGTVIPPSESAASNPVSKNTDETDDWLDDLLAS